MQRSLLKAISPNNLEIKEFRHLNYLKYKMSSMNNSPSTVKVKAETKKKKRKKSRSKRKLGNEVVQFWEAEVSL